MSDAQTPYQILLEIDQRCRALAAGLPSHLAVDHVGIDLTTIEPGTADTWRSALFGVVDHDDRDVPWRRDGALGMRVPLLKLRFENAQVDRFECRLELDLGELFDVSVGNGRTLALEGRYESRVGADGRTRFLRNVGGLWLLQECLREWGDDLEALLEAAAHLPAGGPTVEVDHPSFIAPDDMPARITAACGADPMSRPEITRCIPRGSTGPLASIDLTKPEAMASPSRQQTGGGN